MGDTRKWILSHFDLFISKEVSKLCRALTTNPMNVFEDFTSRELTAAVQFLKPGKTPDFRFRFTLFKTYTSCWTLINATVTHMNELQTTSSLDALHNGQQKDVVVCHSYMTIPDVC